MTPSAVTALQQRDPDDAELLLAAWITFMRAQGNSDSTVYDWPRAVRQAARQTGQHPAAFTTDAVTYWLAGYRNGHTRATYDRALRAFTGWLVRSGRADVDPMARVPRPRTPRRAPKPCADLTLRILLDHPRTTDSTRAMVTLLAFAGLRIHEAAKVAGEDFDLVAGTLRVVGKGGVEAVLPLHPEVRAVAKTMPVAGFWFPSPTRPGEPIRPNSAWLRIRDAAALAGVKLQPHAARHWHATSLLRAGVDLRKVQVLMRHASLATTEGYLQVTDPELTAAVLRLPSLGAQP